MSIDTQARENIAAMIEANHLRQVFPVGSLAETYMICAYIRGATAGVAAANEMIKVQLCETTNAT